MTKLLNVSELIETLGVSRAQIYRLINKGLPVIKVGNNTRFDLSEVMQWIKEQNK
jgi:excisionase family DNA binding protein